MSEINAYVFFGGNCSEAMRFYERTLGGTLRVMTYGDSPAGQAPPGSANLVMHAHLALPGGGVLMASDDTGYQGTKGFSVSLSFTDVEEGRRAFKGLAEGGKVNLPFDKTFWAEGFGMLVDRFGVPWMVNCGQAGAGS